MVPVTGPFIVSPNTPDGRRLGRNAGEIDYSIIVPRVRSIRYGLGMTCKIRYLNRASVKGRILIHPLANYFDTVRHENVHARQYDGPALDEAVSIGNSLDEEFTCCKCADALVAAVQKGFETYVKKAEWQGQVWDYEDYPEGQGKREAGYTAEGFKKEFIQLLNEYQKLLQEAGEACK